MSARRAGWAVVLLVTLTDSSSGDDSRALASLQNLGVEVRRDEERPGRPVVFVDLNGDPVAW